MNLDAYGSVDFAVEIRLLQFEEARVILDFGVHVVLDVHRRLLALGLLQSTNKSIKIFFFKNKTQSIH